MPGKANRSLPTDTEDKDRLVFSWRRRPQGGFWLWGFLVLSLLLHVAGFYMFQVVYPSSGRLEPFPARVLILDEKNAANAVLLQELNDRLVFLQTASAGSEGRKSIDDFAVSFRTSFANRVPPFRKPLAIGQKTETSEAMKLPEKLSSFPPFQAEAIDRVSAPKAVVIKSPDEKPAISRRWLLQGDLAERAMSLAQAEIFDKALPSIGGGPEITLSITINESGQVEQISVKSGKDHPATDQFIEAVKKQLKFDPLLNSGSISGELTIRK